MTILLSLNFLRKHNEFWSAIQEVAHNENCCGQFNLNCTFYLHKSYFTIGPGLLLRSGNFAAEQIRNQEECCLFFIGVIGSSNNIFTCLRPPPVSVPAAAAAAAPLKLDRFVFPGCGLSTPPLQVAAKCQA